MAIKLIRKWSDKSKNYMFGQDCSGKLYCRDNRTRVNLVLVDECFKKGKNFYYKFMNPVTKLVKLVKRG